MPWVLGLGLEDIHSCALKDQLSSSLQGLVTQGCGHVPLGRSGDSSLAQKILYQDVMLDDFMFTALLSESPASPYVFFFRVVGTHLCCP